MTTLPHYNSIINNISQYFFEAHTFTKNLLSESFITYTSKNISCDAYARYLEKLDYEFMISFKCKKHYIVKDIKSRCIETEFGTLSFKRRYYIHKQTMQYYFYLDSEILSLKPYQRLSNDLISNILSNVTIDSYQRITYLKQRFIILYVV